MTNYRLIEGLHLYPTPAGAYYAVCSTENNQSRQFLQQLLQQTNTPALTLDNLHRLMQISEDKRALALLHHCQKLGWIQGLNHSKTFPQGVSDQLLPQFLPKLSNSGKVLLADHLGFPLAYTGFSDEVIEELSVLSAELSIIHSRRCTHLMNQLGISSHAWAIVNAVGKSQIGFWPIFIGDHRFVIVISGLPYFNQPEFVSLVWFLTIRYAI